MAVRLGVATGAQEAAVDIGDDRLAAVSLMRVETRLEHPSALPKGRISSGAD